MAKAMASMANSMLMYGMEHVANKILHPNFQVVGWVLKFTKLKEQRNLINFIKSIHKMLKTIA